jgi:hypothetical protein
MAVFAMCDRFANNRFFKNWAETYLAQLIPAD